MGTGWWRRAAGGLAAGLVAIYLFGDTVRLWRGDGEREGAIRFVHRGGWIEYRLWEDLLRGFSRRWPEFQIEHELIPQNYTRLLSQRLSAGTAADVFTIPDEAVGRLGARWLLPVDAWPGAGEADCTGREFVAAAWRSFSAEGRTYALPLWGGTLMVFVNKTCVERARVCGSGGARVPEDDWTVEEFISSARALTCDTDGDGQIDQYGFAQPGWLYFLPFFYAFGAEVLDEAGCWRLEGPAAVEAVRLYQRLAVDERVCAPPVALGARNEDVAFLTGRVGMAVSGPWFRYFLEEASGGGAYAVVGPPRGRGGRGTRGSWTGIAVRRGLAGRRLAGAVALARYVVSEEAQLRIAQMGRSIPATVRGVEAYAARDEVCARFAESLAYARGNPRHARFWEMDRLLRRYLGLLLAEDEERIGAEEFVARVNAEPVIEAMRCGR